MSSVGSNSATAANSTKPGSVGVKGRVNQFGSYMRNNPMSVRIIGGIGGLGLSIVSILGCFAIFNTFLKPISYILNIFYLVFGLAICIVTILPESFLAESIYKQAHFMSTLGGKSVFFLYLGCLLIGSGLSGSVASWIYILIGSWMLLSCGVLLFVKCKGGEGSSPQQPTA